jgi:hypothetical protein
MSFSTDRDLLAYDPQVFVDAQIAAQPRLSVSDGEVVGATLSSAAADFEAAAVDPGGVVLIAGVAHEVMQRVDSSTLKVSLPRRRLGDAAIPGVQGESLEAVVRTFALQAEEVHTRLLRLIGRACAGGESAKAIDADAVVSLTTVSELEALGTLDMVYGAAAQVTLDAATRQAWEARAMGIRVRLREALARAVILVDLDGDGVADRRVMFNHGRLVRV